MLDRDEGRPGDGGPQLDGRKPPAYIAAYDDHLHHPPSPPRRSGAGLRSRVIVTRAAG
jgi:hypothetical protein